jgi:hypothetical protein
MWWPLGDEAFQSTTGQRDRRATRESETSGSTTTGWPTAWSRGRSLAESA